MLSDKKKLNEKERRGFDETSILPSETLNVRLRRANDLPPCFIMLAGPTHLIGKQWLFKKKSFTVGRSSTADISIDDSSLSKIHAQIILDKKVTSIIDLGSTNKTNLNEKDLVEQDSYSLNNNDQVKMGNIIFKFLEKGNIESLSAAETYDRSTKDNLTQIYNKGAFAHKAAEFFKRAQLLDVDMSLVTFDLDHFKKINDENGHAAGDFILRSAASTIKGSIIRSNDIFARTGGEEFCILLLGSSLSQAKEVAERLRKAIEDTRYEFEKQCIRVTVSVGLSSKTNKDKGWQDLFKRADKALYQSKTSGRNQVTAV